MSAYHPCPSCCCSAEHICIAGCFSTAISAALLPPPAPVIELSPLRQTNAIAAVIHLEADRLTLGQQVALIDFLRDDHTTADTYTALTEADVHKEWVQLQLEQLGILVFDFHGNTLPYTVTT